MSEYRHVNPIYEAEREEQRAAARQQPPSPASCAHNYTRTHNGGGECRFCGDGLTPDEL